MSEALTGSFEVSTHDVATWFRGLSNENKADFLNRVGGGYQNNFDYLDIASKLDERGKRLVSGVSGKIGCRAEWP